MNRLAKETSPYLRQHQDNPVDWYPWGEEAFELARRSDRPVFISIGYSACHWCHVMAHESFEDEQTAAIINEHFVAIKVDREEHPDIDAIYLEAVQALTGGGGWPLSVFVDPDAKPFYGGTYFPKKEAHGLPAFATLLEAVSTAWRERREELLEQGNRLTEVIGERLRPETSESSRLSRGEARQILEGSLQRFVSLFDAEHGGIGSAPKFPQAPMLELLCRKAAEDNPAARSMLETTLGAMAAGGIYDHLGGGFSRYTVDRAWQVPHFEKMLYDQAGLARVYLHAFQITGDRRWAQVVEETLEYVLRDLRDESGGIYSAEDADSEGQEGLFYTWTAGEVEEVLQERAGLAMDWYGMREGANFEGRFILHRPQQGQLVRPPEIEAIRQELFDRRTRRIRPGLDDKILSEWNAMIAGVLAEAGAVLNKPSYLEAAVGIGEFLYHQLRRADGRWMRSWQAGQAMHLAVASDYAWITDCFTRLAESTGKRVWTERATEVAYGLLELFSAENGAIYLTGADATGLIVRPQDSHDGVVPAAGSIAASALVRLGELLADSVLLERAAQIVSSRVELLQASPISFAHLALAALLLEEGAIEIVISGAHEELVALIQRRYLPQAVLAWGETTASELWEGRTRRPGAYVCRKRVCLAPVDRPQDLEEAIDAALLLR